MNRINLLSDCLAKYFVDVTGLRDIPGREMGITDPNYWVAYPLQLFFRIYLGAEYLDTHNIPRTGPAIIASNHLSHLDGLIINAASIYDSMRPVVFMAAADVYEKNLLFRTMCDLVGCIPVKRDARDRSALLRTMRLIKSGSLFGIFPEGRRSRDGVIGEPKHGVANIAIATGCPVIPVGITGTFEALPRKTKVLKPHKVKVKFGELIRFEKRKHPPREVIDAAMERIMGEIMRLHSEIVEDGGRIAA